MTLILNSHCKHFPVDESFSTTFDTFLQNFGYITYKWVIFKSKKQNSKNDDEEFLTDEEHLAEEELQLQNDVAEMIRHGEIAVIKADDPIHFFYLLKITKSHFLPNEVVKDDYGHTSIRQQHSFRQLFRNSVRR